MEPKSDIYWRVQIGVISGLELDILRKKLNDSVLIIAIS